MPLYDDFPYTNFHSLNLDWIVKKLSELENGESTEESSSTVTLARNLSGNYPYTNFHALNLDWVIRSMLELESGFETVENEWQSLRSTGLLNDEMKNAILQCFQNVAWANDQGQLYYDRLYDAFFPPVVVTTLTAVLDQGSRVFVVGENINEIKNYLTVTAELSNGTTITVPSTQYNLTGSLSQEGPNVITVTYMNASTTVTVNAITINLVSISAVYTQSGIVYDNQTLDSLRNDLVVTALWDNQTTTTVTDYTLSGTLTEGTSTITVLYGDKSTTFDVTVTHALTQYTITNNLTQCANSNTATVINELTSYSGTLSANSGYIMGTVSIMMGNTDITSTAYNSSTNAISIASVTGNIVITAEAIEDVGWVSGVAYSDIDWGDGGYALDTSGNIKTSSNSNDHVCDFVPCHNASAINLSVKPHDSFAYFYNENQEFLYRVAYSYQIANANNSEFPIPVPRNAYYFRIYERGTATITPYAYTKLTESTVYQLNTYYSMNYEEGTESSFATSLFGLCYGATSFQTSLFERSFITFYDSEKTLLSTATRQLSATEITIPEGTYYLKINPNNSPSNSNNPWIKFTA